MATGERLSNFVEIFLLYSVIKNNKNVSITIKKHTKKTILMHRFGKNELLFNKTKKTNKVPIKISPNQMEREDKIKMRNELLNTATSAATFQSLEDSKMPEMQIGRSIPRNDDNKFTLPNKKVDFCVNQ